MRRVKCHIPSANGYQLTGIFRTVLGGSCETVTGLDLYHPNGEYVGFVSPHNFSANVRTVLKNNGFRRNKGTGFSRRA